jgi:hypothetical protein
VETRQRFARFLDGMLAELPRKNCWSIAEHAGDPSPDGMQHLLNRAQWDSDGLGEDLRGFVVEHLGEPDAVMIIDESGDVKKGEFTVGVQRQYTGTAGRVENAQVAVYLAYASRTGHAIIDRELYLVRREAPCRIPDEVGGTRRNVPGSDDLPGSEMVKGTRACQETGSRAQAYEAVCRGTRVVWRKLDCLNPNPQMMQSSIRRKDV